MSREGHGSHLLQGEEREKAAPNAELTWPAGSPGGEPLTASPTCPPHPLLPTYAALWKVKVFQENPGQTTLHGSQVQNMGVWPSDPTRSVCLSVCLPTLACKLVVIQCAHSCVGRFRVCSRVLSKDQNDLSFRQACRDATASGMRISGVDTLF